MASSPSSPCSGPADAEKADAEKDPRNGFHRGILSDHQMPLPVRPQCVHILSDYQMAPPLPPLIAQPSAVWELPREPTRNDDEIAVFIKDEQDLQNASTSASTCLACAGLGCSLCGTSGCSKDVQNGGGTCLACGGHGCSLCGMSGHGKDKQEMQTCLACGGLGCGLCGQSGQVEERAEVPNHGEVGGDTRVSIQSDFTDDETEKKGDGEDEEEETDPELLQKEWRKMVLSIVGIVVAWTAITSSLFAIGADFEEPDCRERRRRGTSIRACLECGMGTNVLPLYGEWERTWNNPMRASLYCFGILWIFMGMGIVCDQFMAGIEAITDSEKIVWRPVNGVKRKFRVKIWNPTVANLTLMALGSSAPEILLTATEMAGNGFFSASLGPQTIVGSAAFNLFIISAVCVTALSAPEIKRIENLDPFCVTAFFSIFAYVWLLLILTVFTPDKVDIWEGVVTLLLFPVLIILAYSADQGYIRFTRSKVCLPDFDIEKEQTLAIAKYGKKLPVDTLHRLKFGFGPRMEKSGTKPMGAKPGATAMFGAGEGGKSGFFGAARISASMGRSNSPESEEEFVVVPTIGFVQKRYLVVECGGKVELNIALSTTMENPVSFRYATRDGTAGRGRYKATAGRVHFAPGELETTFSIEILDDGIWQPEENFFVDIDEVKILKGTRFPMSAMGHKETSKDLKVDVDGSDSDCAPENDSASLNSDELEVGIKTAIVTILNDDIAGTLVFGVDEVTAHQATTAVLDVYRADGHCGEVSCSYETLDDSAMGGSDYEPTRGKLVFKDGEEHKQIEVPILPADERGEERMKVCLSDARGGAVFDANTDGGETSAICDIIIAANGYEPMYLKIYRTVLNEDRWELAKELWADQRTELLYCCGSPEDQAEAGILDWVPHIMSLNWKILFLITPPPLLGGGWPCFLIALCMVGGVTCLAGDIAALLGCCLDIPDDITAITLVALGTSLPDTLASRIAAQNDASADNAIGNITGSNSVNVFLGCGISWTIGAIYWWMSGPNEEWLRHTHRGKRFDELFLDKYPDGGFIVAMPSLAFSVTVYSSFASCCVSLLYYRRVRYGGELGGIEFAQRRDAGFLVSLWVSFIASVSVISLI